MAHSAHLAATHYVDPRPARPLRASHPTPRTRDREHRSFHVDVDGALLWTCFVGLVLLMTGILGLFMAETDRPDRPGPGLLPSIGVLAGVTLLVAAAAVAAAVGLARAVRRLHRRRTRTAQMVRSAPPSTGIITPVTKDEAGESTKVATLPNSSGRP